MRADAEPVPRTGTCLLAKLMAAERGTGWRGE
jgi:hypothetical protein